MMNKILISLIVLSMLSLVFGMIGIYTTGGEILTALKILPSNDYTLSNIKTGSLYGDLFSSGAGWLVVGLTGATVVIGIATRTITKIPLAVGLIGILVIFIGDFISIYNTASTYGTFATYSMSILLLPFILLYFIGMIEWFFTVN